jgi:putative hydrolase of the HAD superfamily
VPDWPAVRRYGIALLLQECDCDGGEALSEELTALYFHHRQLPPDPFEDAAVALPRLAGRVPLGIITNGNRQPAQFGLAAHFRAVVTPEITRCLKPEPAIFHHAAALLGCVPAELLHVGDSWEDDVVGALGAGCQAAWYCRGESPCPDPTAPHLVVRDHRDLVPWVMARCG